MFRAICALQLEANYRFDSELAEISLDGRRISLRAKIFA